MVWSADQDDAAGTALSALIGNSPQFNKGSEYQIEHYSISRAGVETICLSPVKTTSETASDTFNTGQICTVSG